MMTVMAKLVYAAITSLDGYTADADGDFTWGAPDPDVFARINDIERAIGTHLYGRRMYEVMAFWETSGTGEDEPPVIRDFAGIWRAADKVVYSTTLAAVASERTRIERAFDPAAVLRMKETATRDISVSGPELAGQALAAGLVDELHLFVTPITVGGGKSALPDGCRASLTLLALERFAGGLVHLHYRVER